MPRRPGRRAAVPFALLAVLTACSAGPDASPPPTTEPTTSRAPFDHDPAAYAAALLTSTNRARAAEDLPPLAPSSCAAAAAASRAQALLGQEELAHASLDPVLDDCAPATKAAENLSRAAAPAADVVEAWLGSPGHADNLLDPDLAEVGIACVDDAGRLLCAQVFLGP